LSAKHPYLEEKVNNFKKKQKYFFLKKVGINLKFNILYVISKTL